MRLSDRLASLLDREADAAADLRRYFSEGPDGPLFSGSRFERLGGGGDRPEVADTFTADDVVAVSMLSVQITGHIAIEILERRNERLGDLLACIPMDKPLVDLEPGELGDDWPVRAAYRELVNIDGVGETTATKLLARKRPQLVPILDSVVTRELAVVHGQYWRPLYEWLRADDRAQHDRLVRIRDAAHIGSDISVLRVFDVLAWMVGSNYATSSRRSP